VRRQLRKPSVPAVAPNLPCPCGSGKKYQACHAKEPPASFDPAAIARAAAAFGVICIVALVVLELFYGFRVSPLQYVEGLRRVNADHDPNYRAVLAGEAQPRFLHYFALAWLLKEPIATILLCAAGVIVLLLRRPAGSAALWILLPGLTWFGVHSLWAANFGVRYVIPAMPFAYLAGGAALGWILSRSAAVGRAVAAVLCLWVVVAAVGIYPDHLSYMNETACVLDDSSRLGLDGGTRCGPMWLDDSNVDWGQGMKQLKTWLEANAKGRAVHIMYHATVPPETYGIQYTPPPPQPTGAPALYVISGHFVARLALTDPNVRTARPLAVVGHAFYVYEF
jgi:hypothetical protein